ncbi:unnamed protein product [Kuraishia capsulata CBS 1993]|uniref:PH domain-containing protein n=1 Tax=Kuraishia capsulata CBS 1993 TaxID=1382522 RepID=W6MKP2_9ASCO|nr:uncharacterized protein KUCA_T00002943001 [Kuraishia capsulata CBS 1993]CDK26966.1 unnamed protein product [Kuraishia capsulata CBS 1993]
MHSNSTKSARSARSDSIGSYLFEDHSRSSTRSTQRERSNSSPLARSIADQDVRDRSQSESDMMYYLQSSPQTPPSYLSLPPGGCPHYPVFANPREGNESLPSYSPTVYKLAILPRKQEWLSPYEAAPQRQWKDVIVELNSTQLNIYAVEPSDPKDTKKSKPLMGEESPSSDYKSCKRYSVYNSAFTGEVDLQNLLNFKSNHMVGTATLLKPYSLQHAKLGVAVDYKKRKHTLRLRCETEQFLLQFGGIQEMVDWYFSLAIGIDNSLDLSAREMPRYRTVPRRRRLRNTADMELLLRRHRHYSPQEVANLFRARRGSAPELRLGVKSTLSLLKSKFSSSSSSSRRQSSDSLASLVEVQTPPSPAPEEVITSLDLLILDDDDIVDDDRTSDMGASVAVSRDSIDVDLDDLEVELDDLDDEESIVDSESAPVVRSTPTNSSSCSTPSSNHSNTTTFDYVPSRASSETSHSSALSEKWTPRYDDLPSSKKMLRDAIRCMQVLMANDRWSGRKLVKDFTSFSSRGDSTAIPYHHSEFRPLQEFVVSPQGLIPCNQSL